MEVLIVQDHQKRERLSWYANKVKFKFVDDEGAEPENPTPVFPALDYTKVSPPLRTFDDHSFFNRPFDLAESARLSLHIFFSLPARGLDISELERQAQSQTEISEAEPVYQYTSNRTSNKESDARRLFRRAVMSEAEQMNFDETYRKMNDLVKGANSRTRAFFKGKTALNRPFQADSRTGEVPENATKGAFAAILNPIIDLFNDLWGNDLDFNTGSTLYEYQNQFDDEPKYTAIPDFAVKENGEPFVCIKVKYPSIYPDTADVCSDVFTQAVTQCICSGTPYGTVTDYLSTLCFKLKLEEKDIEDVKKSTYGKDEFRGFKYVKVSCVRVKHDASVNTLSCVLAAHIFNAREDMLLRRDDYRERLLQLDAALQLTRDERMTRFRQGYQEYFRYLERTTQSFSYTATFTFNNIAEHVDIYDTIRFDQSMRIIQEGESYNTQVLEINKDVFNKLTANMEQTDSKPSHLLKMFEPGPSRYILKIYDAVRGNKDVNFTETSYMKFITHAFFRELVIYRQLKSLWGKCIPRLYHAGICLLSDGDGDDMRFGGMFLILEFIQGKRPDFSRENIRQSAEDALEAIHDLGAAHGDMNARNMIQRGDQVFILDFEKSTGRYYHSTAKGGIQFFCTTGLAALMRKDLEALEKAIGKYGTDSTSTIRVSALFKRLTGSY